MRQAENAVLRVRLATRADVPAIEELIARSARALSDGFYTTPQVESLLRFVFGTDTQLIDDGTYFVAEREDPLLDPRSEPARIRAFFVDPAAARQGVGRRLFDECRSAAAAAGFRTLTLVGHPSRRASLSGAGLHGDRALSVAPARRSRD